MTVAKPFADRGRCFLTWPERTIVGTPTSILTCDDADPAQDVTLENDI